jgi:SagB-type dehydrogenase family enzyme
VTPRPVPLLRSTVYGPAEDALGDPAETFHEASRLHPSLAELHGAGMQRLAASSALQDAAACASRRNLQRPHVRLEPEAVAPYSLWTALERRRSRTSDAPAELPLSRLARLLVAGYGTVGTGRRTVPSGGALYPLEVFVAAQRVAGLAAGIHRFNPYEPSLELVDAVPVATGLAEATPMPELVATASCVLLLTAVFWRARFKYGLRGYRFALLEAGHVAQNVVLAAAALDLPALPLGGFYDARLDELLGLNGVDESVLYAIVVGGRTA